MLINNQWITDEVKEKIKKKKKKIPRDKWKQKLDDPKPTRGSKNSSKIAYTKTSVPQKTRETLKKQRNITPKQPEKGEPMKPQVGRRTEIIKIRTEIKEMETDNRN